MRRDKTGTLTGGAVLILAIGALIGATCGGAKQRGTELGNVKDRPSNQRAYLRVARYPEEAKGYILWTDLSIEVPDKAQRTIGGFSVEFIRGKDQTGRDCPFAGVKLGVTSTGLAIRFGNYYDPETAEQVTVKAQMVLNGEVIKVARGFRKRTLTERQQHDYSCHWTYLDEPQEVTVTPYDGPPIGYWLEHLEVAR